MVTAVEMLKEVGLSEAILENWNMFTKLNLQ